MATCAHVEAMTGIDPVRQWRGAYSDEAGARAIYEPFGGVLALMSDAMKRADFHMTKHMAPGYPVVCDVAGCEIAGLWLGSRVAFMAERGCVEMRAKVLGAWEI